MTRRHRHRVGESRLDRGPCRQRVRIMRFGPTAESGTQVVNEKHLELCSGAQWAEAVRRWIIPWVLDGLDLAGEVLEVGPGPGRTTEVLRDLVPRLTAIEIDPSLASSLARRMASGGVQVVQGDATCLPYDGGRFGAVLSFTMLHHLPSSAAQDRLFAEAARVLRPDGVFAGTDSLDSEEFRELHAGDICVPVEPAGLASRLEEAGFGQVEVETNEYGIRFRAWPPAASVS
jgi:SAM-dependent methyltransferase